MKTATLVKQLTGGRKDVDQALYLLSEPLEGHTHVVVSAASVLGRPETYIFAADESGEITEWLELDGSMRGTLQHKDALAKAGYEVEK